MEMGTERQEEAKVRNDHVVRVESSDCRIFDVPEAGAFQSVIIKNVMEEFGSENPIPVPSVSSDILEKIIEYCTYRLSAKGLCIPSVCKGTMLYRNYYFPFLPFNLELIDRSYVYTLVSIDYLTIIVNCAQTYV